MADEANVTVVFMIPTKGGAFKTQEYEDIEVNARAPVRKLLPALLDAFPEIDLDSDDADLLIQAPDGSSLSNITIQDGCRLVIFPKYSGQLVKRPPKGK